MFFVKHKSVSQLAHRAENSNQSINEQSTFDSGKNS